jgi:hypothetical protein
MVVVVFTVNLALDRFGYYWIGFGICDPFA